MKMKKYFVLAILAVFSWATVAISAEYEVKEGDTISIIAKKLGQRPECLLYANGKEADEMLVPGEELVYSDAEDIKRAKKFAWTQAFPVRSLEDSDENYFLKLYEYLDDNKVKCSEDEEGATPLEILGLADAEAAK